VVYHPTVVIIITRIIVYAIVPFRFPTCVRVSRENCCVASVTFAITAVPWTGIKSTVLETQICVAIALVRVTAPDRHTPVAARGYASRLRRILATVVTPRTML